MYARESMWNRNILDTSLYKFNQWPSGAFSIHFLTELLRCTKAENTHNRFEDLLNRAICNYNYSIHSTTNRKPIEAFLGRKVYTDPSLIEKDRLCNIIKLTEKQKETAVHNKNKTEM